MLKFLKKINLCVLAAMGLCFLASCDEDNEVSFDYKYDGLTCVASYEMSMDKAMELQRLGKVEKVEVGTAEAQPEMNMAAPEDTATDEVSSTDPNFM